MVEPPGLGDPVPLPPELADLLSARDEASATLAWERFLESCGDLILRTARSVNRDHDAAMDVYTHVLERFRLDDVARLRRFSGGDSDNLSRWLVVVSRRMCMDLHRQRYGRPREHTPERERLARKRLVDELWESAIYVIVVADLPSPTPELVYLPSPGCEVDNPTWNRTGSEIAFREVCDPDGERILSVDRGSGAVSIVVPFGVFDGMGPIEWANTVDVLAVTALGPASRGKGEEFTVFSVDLPAGTPQFVGYGLGPTWSPDDSRVAFHYGSKRKIKTADASGGNETTLGSGELPAWRR